MLIYYTSSERQDERRLERSKAIDRLLRVDEKKKASEVKLLLLGATSSGKSTLLKQLRLVYADGYSIKERHVWRGKIFNSLYTSIRRILDIMESRDISLANPENEEHAEMMFIDTVIGPEDLFPTQYQEPFKRLWADEGVQQIFARSDEFAFPENLPYFLDDSTRLFATDYIPTDQDILRCRIITPLNHTQIIATTSKAGFICKHSKDNSLLNDRV